MTPPDDLRLASATALAAAIARKELRAVEVVDAHIAHARAVNPTLNAIVVERFAAARAEAEAADAHQEAGHPLPPLHGVPCTIKESFAFAGMPNCAGLVSRAAYRSPADAITVARLRGAGAIPMGLTNTSELCMWLESDNRVYGRTNNPYQSAHIVGGSSGGEGAIVGSGASPFGLGSDVGGSIRLPAFFNGVFGHKCSPGLIPNSGQFPSANGAEAEGMLSTGPLCRKAVDLWPLLRILAGPDLPAALRRDPATEALAGLRVVLLPRPTWRPACARAFCCGATAWDPAMCTAFTSCWAAKGRRRPWPASCGACFVDSQPTRRPPSASPWWRRCRWATPPPTCAPSTRPGPSSSP